MDDGLIRTEPCLPSASEARSAVNRARRIYLRTLCSWASDIMILRQSGLREIAWHEGSHEQGWWSKAA